MPTFTDLTGLGGITVAIATSALAIPAFQRLGRPRLVVLFASVVILALIPFGALPVAALVRGATGDLSLSTLVLLGCTLLRRLTGRPCLDHRSRFTLLVFLSVAALALYPLSLGLGVFDPYRLGYGSPGLLGVLLVVALVAWFARNHLLASCLALAALGWSVHWYESGNLWDYLVDPLVSFYALGVVAIAGKKRMLQRLAPSRREGEHENFAVRQ